MSTENKQEWDFRMLIQGNSANRVFIISGIIVVAVLLVFYNLNERRQSMSAEKLMELTSKKERLIETNQSIKDKTQMAFNNFLLFSDYHKETQRIEALLYAKSARELLDTYKNEIVENIGPQVLETELGQLESLFSTFETALNNHLDPDNGINNSVQIATDNDAAPQQESTDVSLTEDTNSLVDASELSTGISSPEKSAGVIESVDKRSVLKSLNDINNQLFMVSNAVDLQIRQQILDQRNEKNYGNYIVFTLVILILLVATWFIINFVQKRAISEISDDLKHIAKGERPEQITGKATNFASIVAASDELVNYLDDAGKFAKKIGEGDFGYSFNPKSNNDVLGNSLIEMRNRLQEVAHEDKIRNWTNEGQAKFNELLRMYSDDLEILG